MSGSGTKFLASTLLALNLLPGTLNAPARATTPASSTTTQTGSRFSGQRYANPNPDPQEAQDDGQHPPAHEVRMPLPNPMPTDSELEMARGRRRVNEALRELAQEDFQDMVKLARTGYSSDLDQQETTLSRYLSANNPKVPTVAIMDPTAYETGIALGFTPELTTQKMLEGKHVNLDESWIKIIAGSMSANDPSRFAANHAFTQDPSTYVDDYKTEPQACVLIPTSGYAPEVQIPGFSYAQNVEYINKHEGWHCANTKFSLSAVPQAALDNFDSRNLDKSTGDDNAMLYASIRNKQESMSDVGALGDMVRHGANTDVIDKVAATRYARPDDYLHWTGASLEALKDKIAEMGVDNFRKLNDADAKTLYEGIVDKAAMSPEVAETILTYRETAKDADRAITRDWKENFAILDALKQNGAAIHDGADMKTLDAAIDKAGGDGRMKTALTALRDQINEFGVGNFRKIDDEGVKKITDGLAKSTGMTPEIGGVAMAYAQASPEDRKTFEDAMNKYRSAMPQAMATMAPYGEPPTDAEREAAKNRPDPPAPPLTAEEQKVFQNLAKWDAAKLLQDRAFGAEGKITPATLIHAYAGMQEELRGEVVKNPGDPLLRAKVTKLQQSFISTVQDLDYVDVNAARGVDIFDKEPALVAALKAQQVAATETKPDGPKQQDAKPADVKPDDPKPDDPKPVNPKQPPIALQRAPRPTV